MLDEDPLSIPDEPITAVGPADAIPIAFDLLGLTLRQYASTANPGLAAIGEAPRAASPPLD